MAFNNNEPLIIQWTKKGNLSQSASGTLSSSFNFPISFTKTPKSHLTCMTNGSLGETSYCTAQSLSMSSYKIMAFNTRGTSNDVECRCLFIGY